MDLGLRGKVALISGGTRGIGRATAELLAGEGCRVSISSRDERRLNEAVSSLTPIGSASGVCADVSDPAGADAFLRRSAETLGGVDLLVANIGGSGSASDTFLESTDQSWRDTFQLNFHSTVHLVRAAVPFMRERGGGSIVLIGSVASNVREHHHFEYALAKRAVASLPKLLMWELAPHRIRINTVNPGSTINDDPTTGWARFAKEEPAQFHAYLEGEFPSRRLATSSEIGGVVTFLLSERASWINGTAIAVDGGQASGLRPYPKVGDIG